MPRLLVLDNHDSFTWNLVQHLGELGAAPCVWTSDAVSVEDVVALAPHGIVISPGPGTPREAGISVPVVRRLAGVVPILGVCLGHQAIGSAFGARVVPADRVMHGKTSPVHHDGRGLFAGLPEPFEAMRYHSLLLERATLPPALVCTAWTAEGEVMGVRHHRFAIEGVQFHPESLLTPAGKALLANFLALLATRAAPARSAVG
ncbi:MAG: aminodeoxychorismate/anthranilate synthase component II [Candidatus Binatia bacterium]